MYVSYMYREMTTFVKLKSFPVSSASSPSPFCGDVFYSKSLIPLKDQKEKLRPKLFNGKIKNGTFITYFLCCYCCLIFYSYFGVS